MNKEETKNVLVYVEVADGAPVKVGLEALTPARQIADAKGEEVVAVVLGKDLDAAADAVAAAGANRVVKVDSDELAGYNLEAYADVLGQVIEAEKPAYVLLGGTADGKDIAALVAARFNTGVATDVAGIKVEDDVVYTMSEYSGAINAEVAIKDAAPQVATIRSGAFSKLEDPAKGTVAASDVKVADGAVKAKVLDTVTEITESVNLEDAEVIVAGGRGMGTKEDFALVEELAKVLGGEVGASRPAIEDGWVAKNHQVGQSGKIVAPKLYIAAGISGATQHISGITGSDYIVAINKDEDAPIFSVADVGIVGDAKKVLPIMIEEMKKIKES
ncbi:MAG: electron transfer flavoprotein subunit alpha/FixB family protein [Lachnospiraceae bacterium]|nr:electron transfer flavoprotein subunit alpha/FixB family protein [Lachnospiraceae bacterium]